MVIHFSKVPSKVHNRPELSCLTYIWESSVEWIWFYSHFKM